MYQYQLKLKKKSYDLDSKNFILKNIYLGIELPFKQGLKGIVNDSNYIFLWHESKDINIKKVMSKISVDSNVTFTSYVWLCALELFHN